MELLVLLGFLLTVSLLSGQAQVDEEPGCPQCPKKVFMHYEAKNCTPVFDESVSECCPISFICKTEEERGMKEDACYFKGREYLAGQPVPAESDSACNADCFCSTYRTEGVPASLNCAMHDCPDFINWETSPNCIWADSFDSCCGYQLCPEEGAPPDSITRLADTVTCRANGGQTFNYGRAIYFNEEPCRTCICDETFQEELGSRNKMCREVQCGLEYNDREELRKNCIPIYKDSQGCCPWEWICPDNLEKLRPTAQQVSRSPGNPSTHCTLGNITAARGETLATDNCNLNCQCSFPPEFTCVQFTDCDQAREARLSGSLS